MVGVAINVVQSVKPRIEQRKKTALLVEWMPDERLRKIEVVADCPDSQLPNISDSVSNVAFAQRELDELIYEINADGDTHITEEHYAVYM